MNNFHTPTHFEIPAEDMNRAKKFYEDLFGWKIVSAGPDFPDYFQIFTRENPSTPGIDGGMIKKTGPQHVPLNYINVENIDEDLEKVEKLEGQVLMPKMPIKGFGWNAVCKDTEENVFGLFQDDKSAE